MNMINCIIVDNREDTEQLGKLVAKCPSLNLVGIFNNSTDALDHLSNKNGIDLAFVDFNTAGQNSFERINRLDNPPSVIAVSADGKYALRAFDYNCIDYLIKPVTHSRFYRAIDKTLRINNQRGSGVTPDREIFVRKDTALVKMNVKDIAYIEALENYILLNTIDKKFTLHFTMKGIESQLPPELFLRIHRSFIVNKKLIKTIDESSLKINLGNTLKTVPVGKSYRNLILNDICVMNK
ncbi:MAG: response regulator [Bacteroidales bacterium]|jgi:DNA-binding LytR/AlgR family response regulator|nr:response regulator [Bacteroidales bacterium]HOU01279.1 LytTR family DNA-binding domain-containing protein [Bacteroidales bacterium]HQK67118.1 LytTR family DNA-binding domain-containing protein [Bacteroidales bacterium]